MVFEYVPFDLSGYTELLRDERHERDRYKSGNLFTIGEIKYIFIQLLQALDYCHKQNIIHRDIKISNLLIDEHGQLKLADFGLARQFSQNVTTNMTNRVITLWYRPPELLLGSNHYTCSVDMWSCGCVLSELITSYPLFSADNEVDILKGIVTKLGFPSDKEIKYLKHLPFWNDIKLNPAHPYNMNYSNPTKKIEIENNIKSIQGVGELGLDLIKKLLKWKPCERLNAQEALKHPWFTSNPLPEQIHIREHIKTAHSYMNKCYKKKEIIRAGYKPKFENFRYVNVGQYRKNSFMSKYGSGIDNVVDPGIDHVVESGLDHSVKPGIMGQSVHASTGSIKFFMHVYMYMFMFVYIYFLSTI
uniref:mitogen-activated protein kinase n=1 Tax=Piliocolobus tephrosceles TaxID=591936 RepID=A0A8C9GZV9_9PRIM